MEKEEKNNLKSRDIFYGVVAIATLIVAIIGATLAYFSITASSQEGAVNATAAKVSITYNDGKQITLQADELIPAQFGDADDVVKTAYALATEGKEAVDEPTDKCLDSNQKEVCSIYRFSLKDEVGASKVVATLMPEKNEFKDLAYAVYDVTNNRWLQLNSGAEFVALSDTCSNEDGTIADCYDDTGSTKSYSYKYPVFGYNTLAGAGENPFNTVTLSATDHVYDIVVFIKNIDSPQDYDQGKTFSGTIRVDLVDATGNIQGYIDPALRG